MSAQHHQAVTGARGLLSPSSFHMSGPLLVAQPVMYAGAPFAAAGCAWASVPIAVPGPQVVTQALERARIEAGANLMQSQENLIAQHVLMLAHDRNGCRLVQRALEEAASDEARAAIVEGLRGHIWEVMRCPHANHVLQKYIMTMKPSACQFIIKEILERGSVGLGKAARHKYACRILQRMLEHLRPSQMAEIVDTLLSDSVALSMHRYGNYVMQHLLEHGTEVQQQNAILQLKANVVQLSLNNDACMVLGKALSLGTSEIRSALVTALLKGGGVLASMAHTRRGHVAVVSALESSTGPQFEEAKQQLNQQVASLRANRYGRVVLNFVKQHSEEAVGTGAVVGGA